MPRRFILFSDPCISDLRSFGIRASTIYRVSRSLPRRFILFSDPCLGDFRGNLVRANPAKSNSEARFFPLVESITLNMKISISGCRRAYVGSEVRMEGLGAPCLGDLCCFRILASAIHVVSGSLPRRFVELGETFLSDLYLSLIHI